MFVANCRHCGKRIVQHPSGLWVPRDGTVETDPSGMYCQQLTPGRRPDMAHQPMPSGLEGAPQWMSSDTAQAPITACEAADCAPYKG